MIPLPLIARTCAGLVPLVLSACVGVAPHPDMPAPGVFYTVTGEIALSRHEPHVAALQYAAAAGSANDAELLERAASVTAECLQPSLSASVAARWIDVDPTAVEAHRAAARAALELQKIAQAAAHYRIVLTSSPEGVDAEFARLAAELALSDNIYGARQLADRLALAFPGSGAAVSMQAFTALRADDPAAAARDFAAALALPPAAADPGGEGSARGSDDGAHGGGVPGGDGGVPGGSGAGRSPALERRELQQGLWRARILAGDANQPLLDARALLEREPTTSNRLEYALLLLAAQQTAAAQEELTALARERDSEPVALRLLGLIEFQEGALDDAAAHFAKLVTLGKFIDDSMFYLAQIAERHADFARALRLYAGVQEGENAVPALLRAAALLRTHGAAAASDEVLDRLTDEEPQRAPMILAARARMLADGGDLPRAVALLEAAELQYPDNVDLRYTLAEMVEAGGRFTEALRELKAVAKLRPDDPAALNAYGYTLADHHRQLRLARKLIQQAYDAAPKNPAILDSLGWVLFRQGEAGQALPYLTAAYADDRGGDTAAHLGEVLWRLGRQSDADRIWSEAAQTDADNRLLKATRQRLHAAN